MLTVNANLLKPSAAESRRQDGFRRHSSTSAPRKESNRAISHARAHADQQDKSILEPGEQGVGEAPVWPSLHDPPHRMAELLASSQGSTAKLQEVAGEAWARADHSGIPAGSPGWLHDVPPAMS